MSINKSILRRGTMLTAAFAALAWLAMAVAPAEAMRGGGGGHGGGGHMGGHFSGGHFGGHPGGYGGHYGGHPGGYAGARPGGVGGYGHAGAYGGYGAHGLGYGGYGGYGHGYAGYGGYGGWGHPGYGYGGYGPFHGYGYGWGGFYNPYLYGYGYWPNVPSDYPTDQAYGAEYNENADNQSTDEADESQNDGPQPGADQYGNNGQYGQPYGQYPGAQPPGAGGFTPHVDAAPNAKDQRPHDRGAIHVVVPSAYTIVSFDGQKMLGTGKDRLILTPTVEPGHDFKYQIQATWTDPSEKTITQVREGVVQAGQYVVADFTKPQPEVTPTSASTPIEPAAAPAKP
jgi:uncharacterized protein (TIGR03000 family)